MQSENNKESDMKKATRTIWVGILSALALLTACFSSKGLTKAERARLIKERDSIQQVLERREGASVYGTPEIIQAYGAENKRLRHQLDSINQILGQDEPK